MSHGAALLLACASLAQSPCTLAMSALDEDAMSGVNARDGITAQLGLASGLSETMTQFRWATDRGTAAPGTCTGDTTSPTLQACTLVGNIALAGSGGPLQITGTLDVGSNDRAYIAGTTRDGMGLSATWQPMLLSLGSLSLTTPTVNYSANSIGSIGFISQGSLSLFNVNGPFNIGGNLATLNFSTTNGSVIYRQGAAGSPELSFGNFQFANQFTNGAAGGQLASTGLVGIDNQGLLLSAPFAKVSLLFDLMFKAAPAATGYDTAGRSPVIRFGWTGGLVSPSLRVAPGGIAYGTYATTANNPSGVSYTYYDYSGTNGGGARSQGLHFDNSWNFDTDFAWVLGQAGGNQTQVSFTNWRQMGPTTATPWLSMPVTLDIMQNNNGPAGLCFGGGFTVGDPIQASCTAAGGAWVAGGVPAGKAALAIMLRDGHLNAYNQLASVYDPTKGTTTPVNWSLVYTFGKVDGDFFLYPEGRAQGVAVGTTLTGLKADITMTIQSPGFWDQANGTAAQRAALYTTGAGSKWATNTHFMLADTAVGGNAALQYGVGLMNADLLWQARGMYFRVIAGDSGYPSLPGGLWLQTDSYAQYRFRGVFGGGNLQNLASPVSIGLLDLNLSTNRFIFVLSPTAPVAGDAPVGFNGLLDFDGNAYFSLAEVSNPKASFSISNVQGRIGWQNGTVDLVSGQNTSDGLPHLTISNNLLFGSSANFGDGGGAPLLGNFNFGTEKLGTMSLPGGNWYNSLTIKIPST